MNKTNRGRASACMKMVAIMLAQASIIPYTWNHVVNAGSSQHAFHHTLPPTPPLHQPTGPRIIPQPPPRKRPAKSVCHRNTPEPEQQTCTGIDDNALPRFTPSARPGETLCSLHTTRLERGGRKQHMFFHTQFFLAHASSTALQTLTDETTHTN